jgi:hypothetical protein
MDRRILVLTVICASLFQPLRCHKYDGKSRQHPASVVAAPRTLELIEQPAEPIHKTLKTGWINDNVIDQGSEHKIGSSVIAGPKTFDVSIEQHSAYKTGWANRFRSSQSSHRLAAGVEYGPAKRCSCNYASIKCRKTCWEQ